ncbi:MAG: hypothetical protein WCT14_00495 [Treponemataceae bacterium]
MKARILSLGLVFGTLVTVGSFAVPADLVPAMTKLDKVYIPALGLTGQADQQAKAKIAFSSFESEWTAFTGRFATQAGFDGEWAEDLEKINHVVAKAKTALFEKSNGPASHEALEGVRMTLLESRTRQKVPYFIDALTLYHNAMEDLLNNKPAKKFAEWSASEKMGVAADLDVAIARWNKVKSVEALITDAGLSAKADGVYRTQWQAIETVMSGTKKALETGDEKAFSENLGKLKPNFIKTFFLFGDFPK